MKKHGMKRSSLVLGIGLLGMLNTPDEWSDGKRSVSGNRLREHKRTPRRSYCSL